MKKLSNLEAAVLNEDEQYRSDIKNMLDILHDLAKKSMDGSPIDANITINIGGSNTTVNLSSVELVVPFNADSYDRLVTFLEAEAKEDKELE